jgi:putative aldouronate transport system substrate-binding protein
MKKLLAILLAVIMLISFTACQRKNTEEVGLEETTSALDEDLNPGTTEESSSEKNLYGYDEPITLKVGYARSSDFEWLNGETATDNVWVNLYEENNIFLEILYDVDSSQAETKLSTAIMSGNYPDLITLSSSQLSDYVNYAVTGVIADITDIFEEYATDELKEYVNADGGMVMESLKINGRLYGLPRLSNPYDSVPIMFIRQDWLDNLGLKKPTTMEELKEVAYAFTYDDPDGNGADDTYGLAIDGMEVFTGSIGDANAIFYGYGAYPSGYIEGEDGKVTWGGTNAEGMKAALTLLQEMYQDGSLAKDFITMDSNAIFEEAGSGRCGIWFGPMWAGMKPATDLLAAGFMDSHITAGPIPDGLDQGGCRPFLKSSAANVFCISSQCENPEALIKLMNLSVQKLCHPESEEEYSKYYGVDRQTTGWKASLIPIAGRPLKNYDIYKSVSVALETRDPSNLNMEEITYYNNIVRYLDTLEDGTLDLEDPSTNAGIQRYTVFGDPEGSYAVLDKLIQANQFTPSAYNTVPSERMAELAPTLGKLTVETVVKIITGENVDNYDSFLEKWYNLGGTKLIEDVQAWVDSIK